MIGRSNNANSIILINKNWSNSFGTKTNFNFYFTIICYISSFVSSGLGNTIFNHFVYTDVSTLFIYIAILFQISTKTLRVPRILSILYIYIFFQTFLFNIRSLGDISIIKQYLGLVIFSISLFSFISINRNRIVQIVIIYYRFVFGITCVAILQTILCVFFENRIILTNIVFGNIFSLRINLYEPEILGIIPRAIGLSGEPGHFAILALPGVYIALLVLLGRGREFGLQNKISAWIIFIGFVLSFSIVGYFGLILSVVHILRYDIKKRYILKISVIICSISAFFILTQTSIFAKVDSLIMMLKDIKGYEYTTSDLTGYALVSNMIVAKEALKKSNYLGTGLNTHSYTYDAIIYNHFYSTQILMELNKIDAGSLFIRLTSEFGLPGIIAFLLFLFHYRLNKKIRSTPMKSINGMCLVILISYSVRNGGYLSQYLWLFAAIYYYTYLLQRKDVEQFILEPQEY